MLRPRAAGLALALLAGGGPVLALDPARAPTQYVHDVWRAPLLPHDDVAALLQTRDGYLWMGTVGGLARFDGERVVVRLHDGRFVREPGTGLADHARVRAFAADAAGALWVGAEDGLFRWAGGTLGRVDRPGAPGPDRVLSLLADDRGLWIGTDGGGLDRLAAVPVGREDASDLVARADRALYEAKQAGRDRATLAAPRTAGSSGSIGEGSGRGYDLP